MNEDPTHILVFKTNISTETEKQLIKNVLVSHVHIKDASVDTEDIDKVLRIVSPRLTPGEVIELVTGHGFSCQELE